MAQANYTVTSRDVDGSDKRKYKSFANAVAHFEAMVGYSIDSAIAEQFHMLDVKPTARAVAVVRATSDFGCVVIFERHCAPEAESEPVVAATDSLADMNDEDYAAEMERRGRANAGYVDPDAGDYDIPF